MKRLKAFATSFALLACLLPLVADAQGCRGVRCPDQSQCVTIGEPPGSPTCVCPVDRFSRLRDNVCTAAPLRHWAFLDNQNAARAAVGSLPLVWNTTLAEQARDWASFLAERNGCNRAFSQRPADVGQNLANFFNDLDVRAPQAVNFWVAQGARYTRARFSSTGAAGCSTGFWKDCAAYTQVVWGRTRHVGCAVGRCPNKRGRVWVCNYWPGGNVPGEFPFGRRQ